MAGARRFADLVIWQKARVWSKKIFYATKKDPFCRDLRLVMQINDSTDSVMANIAEGFGRGTQAQFIIFLGYCLGSLDETQSHLCAAYDRQYLSKGEFADLFQQGTEIGKMTISFVRSMVLPGSGARDFKKVKSWTDEVGKPMRESPGNPVRSSFRS
jgi:four helix bundle protein